MSQSQFQIKSWDEKPYFEGKDGIKLTRAVVTKSYTGEISGTGSLEYLMAYNPDGTAHFVGIERIIGSIGKKSGSFTLSHEGTFQNGVANSSFKVIAGSAVADLKGLTGSGRYATGHAMTVLFDFEYHFND